MAHRPPTRRVDRRGIRGPALARMVCSATHEPRRPESGHGCNPAPWIRGRRSAPAGAAGHEAAFAQFHAAAGGSARRPGCPRRLARLPGEAEFTAGEKIYVGVDVGAHQVRHRGLLAEPAAACRGGDLRGRGRLLLGAETVLAVAERYTIVAINFDPWRAAMIITDWETRGLNCTVCPGGHQCDPAAAELYEAIADGKITHPATRRWTGTWRPGWRREGAGCGSTRPTRRPNRRRGRVGDGLRGGYRAAPAPTQILGWM